MNAVLIVVGICGIMDGEIAKNVAEGTKAYVMERTKAYEIKCMSKDA